MEEEIILEGSEGSEVSNNEKAEGSEVIEIDSEIFENQVLTETDNQEVLQILHDINANNVTFYNSITDLVVLLIAVVVGGMAIKTFFTGAIKW